MRLIHGEESERLGGRASHKAHKAIHADRTDNVERCCYDIPPWNVKETPYSVGRLSWISGIYQTPSMQDITLRAPDVISSNRIRARCDD